MALIHYTQDFRVYEETRDQLMPGPFPTPPIFWGKSPGDEVAPPQDGKGVKCPGYAWGGGGGGMLKLRFDRYIILWRYQIMLIGLS